jgi:uroporphyrinogen decarboxylase
MTQRIIGGNLLHDWRSWVNSRERVLQAIDHKPTDRTPCDYAARGEVTERIMADMGYASYEELLQALGVDMRRIPAPYSQDPTGPDEEGYLRDMWGCRYREGDEQGPDSERNQISPFDEATMVQAVHDHAWPDIDALDFGYVKEACQRYGGEYALYGSPWSPFFHEVGWIIGQQRYYVWMHTKPDVVEAIIQHVVEYEAEATRRFLEAAGGLIDITYFGNDFGTQRGLFISPAMYHRFMRPYLKRYFDVSREYGCRVMKHSCGAVRAIIPWLIEDGVEILDPVQVAAAGMGLQSLVREFGDRLSFHGGVNTQSTLPFGSVVDVRAEVRSYIELTRGRGGYILCGSQDYTEDIPTENILAIYDENRA